MPDETSEGTVITGIGRRLVFMVFFMVVLGAVRFVFWAIVAFQFLSHLFTGGVNPNAVRSGARLAEYIYRIMLFLTYQTEAMPFPFGERADRPSGQGR
ncbi:DUF4389 domain-containing protein [Methylococcus geothermalis]|uniref:DUF4389 domain-containing protein n=1 Tax=Methylococcus geothermalis TaxID=2681310 RepID=A0A858Q6C5_9GAMM|nr:DUF4389 domain-containing protein [Methylococcus geothermalis]QJD29422.1 DUF4389 domain-containing protein [Methylococcus geothermalis]